MKSNDPQFRYFMDIHFLFCITLYFLNKMIFVKVFNQNTFMTGYLNDSLLVGCCLPPLIFVIKTLGFRNEYDAPRGEEILIVVLVWSLIFEVIAPFYLNIGVSDLYDVLAYMIGGSISWCIWNFNTINRRVPFFKAPADQRAGRRCLVFSTKGEGLQ